MARTESKTVAAASTDTIKYEIDVLAALVLLLSCTLAYSARYTLNPDGVSYLNLAAALRDGDWGSFVQGYWSPLYPALIALFSKTTHASGMALIPWVHAINSIAVFGVLAIIWRWARRSAHPYFGRTALAAFLLCSVRPPRVEAVTPDLLLIFFATWLGYELLHHGGKRWLCVGLAMGLMFLTKTSCWPWLLAAIPVRAWGATSPTQRRALIFSTVSCVFIMLLWVVPVTRDSGQFNLGSAGKLNACWYLRSCDSRTPDSHKGNHHNYANIRMGDGREIAIARFDDRSPWTYQPWGDPTAWADGVTTMTSGTPTFKSLMSYWSKNAAHVFGFWILPVLLGIVAPMYWVKRRKGIWRELAHGQRDSAVVILLGFLGVGQFVAVHAEPRLIAPFVMLVALGSLNWLHHQPQQPKAGAKPTSIAWSLQFATLAGLLFGLGQMLFRLGEGFEVDRRIEQGYAMMRQAKASITPPGETNTRLVVVGDAMKVVENAYLLDWHIVAQIRPASVEGIVTLPPAQLEATLSELFGGIADAAWIALPGGQQFQFARIRRK